MNMSEIEARQLLALSDSLKQQLQFIGGVVVDATFSETEKLELIGVALGVVEVESVYGVDEER